MALTRQARLFARQVYVDLLALSDRDLSQTLHGWVNGEPSGSAPTVSEETLSTLGYTFRYDITPPTASLDPGDNIAKEILTPSAKRLRETLETMDIKSFVETVLPLAFQALHLAHPEWSEGETFHAHLANHLRWIRKEAARVGD